VSIRMLRPSLHPKLLQGLLERGQLDLAAWIVRGPVHEHTKPPHPFGRLCPRRERLRRRAAKRWL
jgi:hypothetical protein